MADRAAHSASLAKRLRRWRLLMVYTAVGLTCLTLLGSARAGDAANRPLSIQAPPGLAAGPEGWTSPEGLSSTLQVMLLLTVISLAPAVLLMTTCFVRIVVVLSLLRQAVGTQQLPPSQVITSLALFISLLIMSPVWKQVYDEAIVPYTHHQITLEQAWKSGAAPIRRFMSMQIERTNNGDDVRLFLAYMPDHPTPKSYEDVPPASVAAGLYAQRIEDRLSHRLQNLSALPRSRHGCGQRDGFDGDVDVAAGLGFPSLQDPVVRVDRRLAAGGADAHGKLSAVYVRVGPLRKSGRRKRPWTHKPLWMSPGKPSG